MFYKKLNINETEYPLAVNITGKGAPTSNTEGEIGMLYMNTEDGSMYKCVEEGTWEPIVDLSDYPTQDEVSEQIKAAFKKEEALEFPYGNLSNHVGYFEKGTLWAAATGNSMGIRDTTDCIRTRMVTVGEIPVEDSTVAIPFKKGDYIEVNGDIEIRAILVNGVGNYTTVANFVAGGFVIPDDGNYYLAFYFVGEEISDDIASYLSDIYVTEAAKEKVDFVNEAKGVYSIMTYNTGLWYNGSGNILPEDKKEEYLGLAKNIIDRYSPDILCLQEYCDPSDNLLEERYSSIVTAKDNASTNNYVGKAICSNREIFDASNTLFDANGTSDSPNYEKAYVWLNGRKVCIISAHFAVDSSVALTQLGVLVNVVQSEPYFIICADTNIDASDTDSSGTKNIDKIKNAFDNLSVECNICNGGSFGVFDTYHRTTESEGEVAKAIDNIITSKNIVVRSVIVDTQKESLESEDRDHYPLIAYVEIDGLDIERYLTIDSEVIL